MILQLYMYAPAKFYPMVLRVRLIRSKHTVSIGLLIRWPGLLNSLSSPAPPERILYSCSCNPGAAPGGIPGEFPPQISVSERARAQHNLPCFSRTSSTQWHSTTQVQVPSSKHTLPRASSSPSSLQLPRAAAAAAAAPMQLH